MFGVKKLVKATVLLLGFGMVSACAAQYQNHGYVPTETEVAELIVDVDTRATVDDVVGPPSTSGILGGGDYYYIRSRVKSFGMFRPKEIERQVLAISFNEDDTIANIERFGLEKGRIVPLSRRITDSSVVGDGFLRQMLNNLANFNPGQLLN
ncbi:Outer membrane beta-barrel assembly protein BamE [hydrothermal vent metagenome]|uniref:Outer membrane beta-barrel assembly protein BamE n=1 Tax=hydrothermal vent metagenome TaxID=652676 RepID=A0A3B0SHD7_9ZZZZ